MADAVFPPDFAGRCERLRLLARRYPARRRRRASPRAPGGSAFRDRRDYSPGDDARHVDWPVYARLERLLVRLNEHDERRRVAILVDVSGSLAPRGEGSRFRAALRVAGTLAWLAAAHWDRLEVAAVADRVVARRAGSGTGAAGELLRFLASLAPGGPTDLDRAVVGWLSGAKPGVAILVSDLEDPGVERALGRLVHAGHEVHAVRVHAPEDLAPAWAGPVRLVDAETGEGLVLEAGPREREAARGAAARREAARAAWCAACGVGYVCAASDRPFEEAVEALLESGGVAP